jgi:hypothetical protein
VAGLIAILLAICILCPQAFPILIVGFIILVIWGSVLSHYKTTAEKEAREKAAKELVASRPGSTRFAGQLAGGNHPLLGSTVIDLEFVLSFDSLTAVIAGKEGIVFPLRNVKAQVTTQSAVTALGILMYGVAGMVAKDKITVLDIEDNTSKERYNAVFKMKDNEAFADQINRSRYDLLTTANTQQGTTVPR